MNANTEYLNQVIVGLADLVREVHLRGRTARFEMRAPALLDEAMRALKQSPAGEEFQAATAAQVQENLRSLAWPEARYSSVN